jgi:hypothetical protein
MVSTLNSENSTNAKQNRMSSQRPVCGRARINWTTEQEMSQVEKP